jgi:hypothetical protein
VVEIATGNYDRAVELAERLAALTQCLADADPAAAAARARSPSEAQWTLAWALLGRALAEDDRDAAERSRHYFAAQADAAAASGTLVEQGRSLDDLALSLFALDAYSESIAMGQRGLRRFLEMEATLAAETGWVADPLFSIGISLCGSGDVDAGISLVSAARRLYREEGVAEWAMQQTAVDRIEKSAREALGDEGYAAAVRAGEAFSRDEAVELALSSVAR